MRPIEILYRLQSMGKRVNVSIYFFGDIRIGSMPPRWHVKITLKPHADNPDSKIEIEHSNADFELALQVAWREFGKVLSTCPLR